MLQAEIKFDQLIPKKFSPKKQISLNRIHSYPAKMVSDIAATFIQSEICPKGKNHILLDPFCGSGTCLLEAKRAGVNAFGVDISPLARLITKTTIENYNIKKLKELEKKLIISIERILKQKSIITYKKKVKVKNLSLWFQPSAIHQLAAIKLGIKKLKTNKKYKNFFLMTFSSIIRSSSNADREISPVVISKKMRKKISEGFIPNPIQLFEKKFKRNIKSIKKEIESKKGLKFEIVGKDARKLDIKNNSVDFVITSPPYINAQKYVRSTQLELQWLDFCFNDSLIELDRKMIGTERVAARQYSEIILTDSKLLNKCIKKIFEKDRLRAFVVSKYFTDMQQCLSEISRVLKNDCYFVLVVGDNVIRGIKIPLNKILSEAAEDFGLVLKKSLKNKIKKRKLSIIRNKTARAMDCEKILIFRKIQEVR